MKQMPKVKHRLPSIRLSNSRAKKLLREIKPFIKGHVVGEYPSIEYVARELGYDLGLVG
jgi:hypothetical protein